MFVYLTNVGQAAETGTVVSPPPNVPQKGILSVASNEKYGIDCIFYGSQVVAYDAKGQIAVETRVIRDILMYDRASAHYKRYEPLDKTSLKTSLGFYEEVWSPNLEYLVLPRGRFEGFQVIHAAHVLERLNHKQNMFIRVFMDRIESDVDTALWHAFRKWVGDDAFLFTAGISYSNPPFIYEIGTKTLFSLETAFDTENEGGSLSVEKPPDATVLDDRDLHKLSVGMTRGIVLLRCGEPVSPHHLPVWLYPSKEGYYHYVFYFWPTNEVERPASAKDDTLVLVAITKVSLEERGYVSEEPYISKEVYIFPEYVKGQTFTGIQKLLSQR